MLLNSHIPDYAMCFARKVCGLVRSTWGTSLGGDKLGARDRILNTKVGRRVRAWQTFPPIPHMYHRCPAQNIERETNIVRLPVALLGNLYRRACDMLRSVAWKFSKTLGKMLGSFGSQIGPPKRNRYR